MVDSVFITGANSGAFTDALSGLPPWATETTALAIQQQLRLHTVSLSELVKKFSKGGGGGAGEDPKLIDNLNKLRAEALEQAKKDKDEAKKKAKDDKAQAEKDLLWGKQRTTSTEAWVDALHILDKIGAKVVETLKQNIASYDALNEGGINLVSGLDSASTGFEGLRQITALTGVRYSELQATMLKFSTSINAFGVGKFAKAVGIASADLTKFGYSSKEAAELTGTYLESQRGFTDTRNKSEQEVAAEVVQFGSRITAVSLATGMMRGKILENLDAISKSTTAALLAGQTSASQAQLLTEFGASFRDQKLGNDLLAMMSDAIKPLNKTFMALQKTGGGAFAQAEMNLLNKMKLSGASEEEKQEQLADFVKANEAGIVKQMQINNMLAQNGDANAAAANEHLNALLQQSRSYKKLTAEEKAKLEKTSKSSKDLANAQERFAGQWQRTLANLTPVLTAITWVLNAVSTVIESVVDGISWVGRLVGIDGLGSIVATLLGGVAVIISAIAGLRGGIMAVRGIFNFLLPNVIKTMIGNIGKFFLNGFTRIFGSLFSGGGNIIKRAFSSLGSVFKFIGTALSKSFNIIKQSLGSLGSVFKFMSNVLTNSIGTIGRMFSSISGFIAEGFGSMFGGLTKGFSFIGRMFSSISGFIAEGFGSMFGGLTKGFSFIGRIIGSIGGVALKFMGVIGWLYTAFEVGYAIGTYIYGMIKDFKWFTTLMETIFKALDHVLQYIPGSTGSDAKERIAANDKASAAETSKSTAINAEPSAKSTEISIPKNPTPSTIDSPSAKPPASSGDSSTATPSTPASAAPSPPVKSSATDTGDITSQLDSHNSLLEQLLSVMQNSVSVNKDILRYTKNQA